MPTRYVSIVSDNYFLVAGSQGLTVTRVVASTNTTATTSFSVSRASSVVGGTPQPIVSMDDPAPAPLASLLYAPTGFTSVGGLGSVDLGAPAADVAVVHGPVEVSAGNALRFQVSGTGSTMMHIYFEE